MRRLQRSPAALRLTSVLLLLCLCAGALGGGGARAQLLSNLTQSVTQTLSQTPAGLVSPLVKVSPDLLGLVRLAQPGERVRVVIQADNPLSLALATLLFTLDARTTRTYRNLQMRAVELPAGNVLTLAASSLVSFVSPDREVRLLGHLSHTTGADAARMASAGGGLEGTGVGIAVLDSGVYAEHKEFLNKSNGVRVVYSRDFTGEGKVTDPFGHGTHVASIAAGNGRVASGAYRGVAPDANLLNLRVLDSRGLGSASGLLSALDWVLTNRAAYNVRVVNLSLGTSAVDSYRDDPLCRAVRRLVDAGVVVVAAAGNEGKDASGNKLYGSIHSPGIEPSAVTVGAVNTFGTDWRSDDGVATYSSRGPTRGHTVNAWGVRHYDNLIKPDLVAPGNKLIAAEAVRNRLVTERPELDAGVSPVAERKMMSLSGTSMATPAVAGAAALMLQANPKLTPNLVKVILMYTAQPLRGFNTFEQGMGQLNVEGAVRLARLVRADLTSATPVGAPLLTTAAVPEARTNVAGHAFDWSRGVVLNHTFAAGPAPVSKYQRFYGAGFLLGDGVVVGGGVIAGDARMMSDGVLLGDGVMVSDGVIAGDGSPFCAYSLLLGAGGARLSEGQVIGDGVIAGDAGGPLAGDGVIAGDTWARGDDTECMAPAADGG